MTRISTPQELRDLMATLEREIRKDELYHAMLTVERYGGCSPEETETIGKLGERMQELDGNPYPHKLPSIAAETTQGTVTRISGGIRR